MEPDPTDFRLAEGVSGHPYAPSIEAFGHSLAVLFSDMTQAYKVAGETTDIDEPLYACLFDGRRFTTPFPIAQAGRNRYARAVAVGGRLLVVWKSGLPYPSAEWGEYMFHDITLALVDPLAGTVSSTPYVSDVKYNSSPDVSIVGDRACVMFTKHEHLYGLADDPAAFMGVYAGWIDLPRSKPAD
jgi:hypothetical protein